MSTLTFILHFNVFNGSNGSFSNTALESVVYGNIGHLCIIPKFLLMFGVFWLSVIAECLRTIKMYNATVLKLQ